jgi:hypothetical protein
MTAEHTPNPDPAVEAAWQHHAALQAEANAALDGLTPAQRDAGLDDPANMRAYELRTEAEIAAQEYDDLTAAAPDSPWAEADARYVEAEAELEAG